jgi:hypothetical protein
MFRALSPKSRFMYCAHVLIRGEELCRPQTFEHESAGRQRWYFKLLWSPGIDSVSLFSLAGRHENPISTHTQSDFYSVST